MGNTFKSILLWVALCVGLMAAFNALTSKQENKQQIEYSQFIQQVNNGEVANVNIEGSVVSGYLIKGERTDKTSFFTNAPLDDNLVKTLLDNKVRVNVIPEEKTKHARQPVLQPVAGIVVDWRMVLFYASCKRWRR